MRVFILTPLPINGAKGFSIFTATIVCLSYLRMFRPAAPLFILRTGFAQVNMGKRHEKGKRCYNYKQQRFCH